MNRHGTSFPTISEPPWDRFFRKTCYKDTISETSRQVPLIWFHPTGGECLNGRSLLFSDSEIPCDSLSIWDSRRSFISRLSTPGVSVVAATDAICWTLCLRGWPCARMVDPPIHEGHENGTHRHRDSRC